VIPVKARAAIAMVALAVGLAAIGTSFASAAPHTGSGDSALAAKKKCTPKKARSSKAKKCKKKKQSSATAPVASPVTSPPVDKIPPVVVITAEPADHSASADGAFNYSVDDGSATVHCTLDGPSIPCNSTTANYAGLIDGPHTFVVTATDPAGIAGSDQSSWVVDTLAPIISSPLVRSGGYATSGSFSYAITDADPLLAVHCTLNLDPWLCTETGATYSGLGQGINSFNVQAVDRAGNASIVNATWLVDSVPPDVTFSSPDDATVKSGGGVFAPTVQFTFVTSEDTSGILCHFDSELPVSCLPGAGYGHSGGLTPGFHTLTIQPTDLHDNTATLVYFFQIS
jgi:hypothetical protein